MTAFTAQNQRGHFSMDRTHFGYAYLGKIPLAAGINDVQFHCVGTPLLFIEIPYNTSDDTGQVLSNSQYNSKVGTVVAGVDCDSGSWTWTARTIVNEYVNRAAPTRYLRVFGRVDLNWPNGSGRVPNLTLRTDSNQLVFDAGLRMLKLAGDTYDVELTLSATTPAWSDPNNNCDSSVSLPFDLANKSISVSPRSSLGATYYTGSYQGFDPPETVNQFVRYYWDTVFDAVNSTLRIKKSPRSDQPRFDSPGYIYDAGGALPNYSRLAVIDNTKYP